MEWMYKKINNKKGFTLIELIVVIAIIGILAMVAVPKLGGFIASAEARTDQANAKLLTNIAHVIQADTGKFPTIGTLAPGVWLASFTEMLPVNAKDLTTETITRQSDTGIFSYSATTGIVKFTP